MGFHPIATFDMSKSPLQLKTVRFIFMTKLMPSIHVCVFLTQRTTKMDRPLKESLYPK